MAGWIKCTARGGKQAIYVNLGLAITLVEQPKGTRIAFAGGSQDYAEVTESPEEILKARKSNA